MVQGLVDALAEGACVLLPALQEHLLLGPAFRPARCVAVSCDDGNNGGCHTNATCAVVNATAVACTCVSGRSGDGHTCAPDEGAQQGDAGGKVAAASSVWIVFVVWFLVLLLIVLLLLIVR